MGSDPGDPGPAEHRSRSSYDALALRHVEDLAVATIADRMGCTVGTAKSHLSRGTERLREYAAAAGITAETREESP